MSETTRTGEIPTERPRSIDVMALLPLIAFGAALLLAFGFEIFNFNLTIDEEVTATVGRLTRASWSVAEGRWAMAGLTLLIPTPVAPVVSTAIGIGLSAVTWWILGRRFFGMSPRQASLAAAVAGTIPVLAFLFSFDTIAFAVGVGHLLLLAFAAGIGSTSWLYRSFGVLAAAAAIGIYDSFLMALAVAALGLIIRAPRWVTVLFAAGGLLAAFALSRLIGLLVTALSGVTTSSYTSSFIDLAGLLADPRGRLKSALFDVASTFFVTYERFGLSSPWLGVLVLALTAGAIVVVATTTGTLSERIIRIVALVAVLAVPFVVEAVASVVVFRAMVYLPIVVLVVASVAFGGAVRFRPRLRRAAYVLVSVLALLAIVGNATVTNRLFSVAATTYALDQDLAFQIGQEKDELLGGDQYQEVPLVVNGLHGWAGGEFTEVHETFGLSFFDLDERRTIAFLQVHGVQVTTATEKQHERAESSFATMPAYPYDGWIALDHGVLLVNFGNPR